MAPCILRYGLSMLLLLAAPLFNSRAQSVDQLLQSGDSLYAAFENEAALQMYQQALTLDSTSFDARLRVTRTSYDYGLDLVAAGNSDTAFDRFEASVRHARTMTRQFPDSAQAHFLMAAMAGNLALFKSGREKVLLGRMVETHSKTAISLDSLFAYPYVSLGIYYREFARLNWLERALAKMFFGRLPDVSMEEAHHMLTRALELRPNFPFLHFELAMTFLSENQPVRAATHLETLIALPPETTQDKRNQEYARRLLKELQAGQSAIATHPISRPPSNSPNPPGLPGPFGLLKPFGLPGPF